MGNLIKKEAVILFFGDVFFFVFSLWLSLYLRFTELPTWDRFETHLTPFSILFVVWFLVYFIAGLYENHTLILKSKLPSIIFNAQVVNSIFTIIFFYTVPVFGITPKTILFIYLAVSFLCVLVWRLYGIRIFGSKERQPALLIGSGVEMKELFDEVNGNNKYDLSFVMSVDVASLESLDVQNEIITPIYSNGIKIIAVDFSHKNVSPLLPHLYNLIFSKIRFIDSHRIYEDIFDRIPLSLVTYSWFLENISVSPKFTYDFLKRIMDIILSFILGVISLILCPLVWIAIKFDDGGKIFIKQERVGQNNHLIQILKFRTMLVDDGGDGEANRAQKITRVGQFLRASRIDELPQLWNVFKGDISLIGPRPELPNLVSLYEKEISFYNVRHLIKPGLSGWAQIYQKTPPKFSTDYDQTKTKLSYDLFYIKNRSFWLDIKIALKTTKILLSKEGL
ncbi:MAG: exopolysaccharide biosynthesis polyprenyl glycosylphosphotransferase [Candidatus Paceibacterota bacterium]|jgi:exopolysaccharide biosynthesis polyprenyl glycosylphosphotransferase